MRVTNVSTTSSSSSSSSPAEITKQIKTLLKQQLDDVRADSARLDELRKLFTRLESSGELVFCGSSTTTDVDLFGGTDNDDPAAAAALQKWNKFLHSSHAKFVDQLCDRIHISRHASIRCMWGVLSGSPVTFKLDKALPSSVEEQQKKYKVLNTQLLKRWMEAMIGREQPDPVGGSGSVSGTTLLMDQGLRHMVETEFIQPYRDVQYYCLTSITGLATETYNKNENPVVVDDDEDSRDSQEKEDVTVRADRLLELLMLIPVPTSQDELVQERGGANGGNHLIPPPTRQQQQQILPPGENEDVDGSNDDDSDFDSDDDDSSSSDSDSDNQSKAKRPSKKAKTTFQKKKKNLNLLPFQQLRAFKREYQRAWLAVLRLPLSTPALKRALNFLPQHVLNYVNHPLRFSDFFMQAYSDNDENTGGGSGIIGVLALDGLFQLITQYDLEYPNFYKQLYKLVTAKVMHVKYRARFFDLLNRCLVRNEMLPAHVVAAFIKRLCRCAISSPPPAILFVLALVSNLIRKHPECSCLIHRRNKKAQSSEVLEIVDGYDAEQDDPVKSGALQSSLWELSALERHYYPAVATMAKSVGTTEEIDAPAYNVMADFVQHTYSSLFDQERKRYHHQLQQQNNDKSSAADDMYNAKKRKITKTALVFKEPTSLFTDSDVFADFLSL